MLRLAVIGLMLDLAVKRSANMPESPIAPHASSPQELRERIVKVLAG